MLGPSATILYVGTKDQTISRGTPAPRAPAGPLPPTTRATPRPFPSGPPTPAPSPSPAGLRHAARRGRERRSPRAGRAARFPQHPLRHPTPAARRGARTVGAGAREREARREADGGGAQGRLAGQRRIPVPLPPRPGAAPVLRESRGAHQGRLHPPPAGPPAERRRLSRPARPPGPPVALLRVGQPPRRPRRRGAPVPPDLPEPGGPQGGNPRPPATPPARHAPRPPRPARR